MIEPGGGCPQAGLDVAQALAKGQLRKGHAQKLIPTGEALDFEVAVVPLNALAKFVSREKIHQLGENSFSGIHGRVPPSSVKEVPIFAQLISNR
jgi:hypothetical protein